MKVCCHQQSYALTCSPQNDAQRGCAGTWGKRMRHRFIWTFDWAWPHIKEMASVLTMTTLFTIAVHTLPSALRSRAALHKAIKCGTAAL